MRLWSALLFFAVAGCNCGPSAVARAERRGHRAGLVEEDHQIRLHRRAAAGTSSCPCQFPSCNEQTCPTRMGSVRSAMQAFLTTSGRIAHMGLTIYPAD